MCFGHPEIQDTAVIGDACPRPTWRRAQVTLITETGRYAGRPAWITIKPGADPIRLGVEMAHEEQCGIELRIPRDTF